MKAVVNVYLKEGVLDPQGKAVHHALGSLGFTGVRDARIGRQIVLEMDDDDPDKTMKKLREMSETLLANTTIEDYDIEIAE